MSILSWNCQGLGNPYTIRELLLLLKEQAPSILFLFETRLDCVSIEKLRVHLKFGGVFCVPRVGTGGGLVLFWNAKMEVQIQSYYRNHIDAVFMEKVGGRSFRFTGFYGNPMTSKRKKSWALLKHLSHIYVLSLWLCIGDFNEVLDNNERVGRGFRPAWQIQNFRDCVAHCGLHDIGFNGHPFNWRRKRFSSHDGDCAAARLDRTLVSDSWILAFQGMGVTHLPVQNSDHCPLLVTLPNGLQGYKSKRMFRFEAMWTKDVQCYDVINQAWNSDVAVGSKMFQVMEKLKICRGSLIAWSKVRFRSLASLIKEKRMQLQTLLSTHPLGDSPRILEL